jgi:hypothetical protein
MAWLVYDSVTGKPTPIAHSPFIIGRSSDCDLKIEDATLSRQHLQIMLNGRRLEINGISADNPFYIQGMSFTHYTLEPKSVILLEIGAVKIIFAIDTVDVSSLMAKHFVVVEKYCFSTEGIFSGPFTGEQLAEEIASGALCHDSLFWVFGNEKEKILAGEVEGLEFPNQPLSLSEQDISTMLSCQDGKEFTCPFCRNTTSVDNVLAVSVDPNSMGDPVLGEQEQQRFLPARFTPDGLAIDAGGAICPDVACPKCHMILPAAVLNDQLCIMSIVGAPASGKSYFIASAAWHMRSVLPSKFGIAFMDVDPSINRWINDYEEILFFQEDRESLQNIVKTDLQSNMVYRQILMDGHPMFLPLPSLFHVSSSAATSDRKILALYDNAGEHFQVGADNRSMPGTLHILHAESILFLFDPTGDPRFRGLLSKGKGTSSNRAQRQDVLLAEMASRIRRHLGNQSKAKLANPLIFGVSKADLLLHLLPKELSPYEKDDSGQTCLNLTAIGKMSAALRKIIEQHAPELIHTVESIAQHVVYMPVSALGHNPMREGVRPCDIHAFWVEVPLVYTLGAMGVIPVVGSLQGGEAEATIT